MVNNKLFCQYLVLNSDKNILRHKIEENFGVDMSNIVTEEGIYNTLIEILRKGKDEAFKKMMTFHPDILRYERVFGDGNKNNIIEKSQQQNHTPISMQKIINIAIVIDLTLIAAVSIKTLFFNK